MVRQILDRMPKGEICNGPTHIPRGEGVGRYEAPRGEDIHYVRSNGTNMPERLKVRAPSFVNVPSYTASCIGESIADVTIALAACDPCYSCTERVAAVRRDDGPDLGWADLVRLGRERTHALAREMGREPGLRLEGRR